MSRNTAKRGDRLIERLNVKELNGLIRDFRTIRVELQQLSHSLSSSRIELSACARDLNGIVDDATSTLALTYIYSIVSASETPHSVWLDRLLPTDKAADIQANLEDVFVNTWVPTHGEDAAVKIYHCQVFQVIARHFLDGLIDRATRIISAVRLIGGN